MDSAGGQIEETCEDGAPKVTGVSSGILDDAHEGRCCRGLWVRCGSGEHKLDVEVREAGRDALRERTAAGGEHAVLLRELVLARDERLVEHDRRVCRVCSIQRDHVHERVVRCSAVAGPREDRLHEDAAAALCAEHRGERSLEARDLAQDGLISVAEAADVLPRHDRAVPVQERCTRWECEAAVWCEGKDTCTRTQTARFGLCTFRHPL